MATNSTDVDPLYSENELHHEVEVFEFIGILSFQSKGMVIVTVKILIDLFELLSLVICRSISIEAAIP